MGRSPGQRFRCEQYIEFLEQQGFQVSYSNLIAEEEDEVFYSNGKFFQKLLLFIKAFRRRLRDVKRASEYDIIFIYREALMIGTTYFERRFVKSGAKIIFDFDDSIWLNDVSQGNYKLKWMKRPAKTSDIIRLSDMVFAGNTYLADYAQQYNKNVKIVPTTINTNYHTLRKPKFNHSAICIGWTGTSTTLKHFEVAIPVLRKLKQKYEGRIYFKVIVNFPYEVKELDLLATEWRKETEIEDLSEFDIGIMPLPDDNWSKGKCGFKGLQYMAMEISTVMSPVGINSEIINDGENGFLANSDEEWAVKLSKLIESPELRERLGKAGRQTVIERYSVESQKNDYLKYFNELLGIS